jgi:hypothetical protein
LAGISTVPPGAGKPGFGVVESGLLMNKCVLLWEVRGESGGIPHLAKNERDAGAPGLVAGIEPGAAAFHCWVMGLLVVT